MNMDLFEQISNDIKEAMKAKDKVRLETLRNVKKCFLEAKTAPGANDTLTDDAALKIMQESYTPLSEPRFEGYYGKVSQLYDVLRKMQQELPARAAAGESIDTLAEETWALLCAIH